MHSLALLWCSFCNIYIPKITTFYTLNLHNFCHLYLNKARKILKLELHDSVSPLLDIRQ